MLCRCCNYWRADCGPLCDACAGDTSKHRHAVDELFAYRKATGGLSPALVAQALAALRNDRLPTMAAALMACGDLTPDEIAQLRAATFEVVET